MPHERRIARHPRVARGPDMEAWVATLSILSAVLCRRGIQWGVSFQMMFIISKASISGDRLG